jgi:uncharacterized protein with von Willebrand factor type A (vWA) domain
MIRTHSNKRYISPNHYEVCERFKEIGFTLPYSYDLAVDLANAYSFVMAGEHPSNAINSLSLDDFSNYPEEKAQELLEYNQNVQRFINGINWGSYSGYTPLEKAASVIAMLSAQAEDAQDASGDESEGTPLPIFSNKKGEEMAKQINEEVENLPPIDAFTESALDKFLDIKGSTKEVRSANIPKNKLNLVKKLALLGNRGKIKAIRTSAKTSPQRMSEYGEATRLNSMSSVGLPTYGYKLATKQLVVKKPQQSAKQMLIVLMDISGSMNDSAKQEWVKALLLNRLDAVLKNEAELIVIPFAAEIYPEDTWVFVTTKAQAAKKAIDLRKSNLFSFSGGGTNVQRASEQTEELISRKKFGSKDFQIVIMNDGEDSVDANYKPKVKTHAFILGKDNAGLKSVVESTGGLYERFL